MLEDAARNGIPYLAHRPLGNGALVRPDSPIVDAARRADMHPATLALAWLLDQSPNVAVTPGTSNPAHVPDLVAAGTAVLDDAIRRSLDLVRVQ